MFLRVDFSDEINLTILTSFLIDDFCNTSETTSAFFIISIETSMERRVISEYKSKLCIREQQIKEKKESLREAKGKGRGKEDTSWEYVTNEEEDRKIAEYYNRSSCTTIVSV